MGKLGNKDWWLGKTDEQQARGDERQAKFEARQAKLRERIDEADRKAAEAKERAAHLKTAEGKAEVAAAAERKQATIKAEAESKAVERQALHESRAAAAAAEHEALKAQRDAEKTDRSPKPSFRERMKGAADKAAAHVELHKYDREFEDIRIDGSSLHIKGGGTWQVAECSAQVDHGANLQPRLTASRLVMTGGFALLLKKDRNKVYLMVETPGDAHLIELKAKKETDARKFAMQVNNAARHFSQG